MSTMPLIEARGLVRRYGNGAAAITALNGVDLRVETGEFLAVMGPSGSGKSSLMHLIGLLDAPTAGMLRFRDTDVVQMHADDRADLRNRHIGFVFQAYHLLPRRSAQGNVELPLLYAGASPPERRRRTAAALERVGLTDRANAFPSELSGGEQQRVAIARALVSEPDLVVADEPTGALDSRTAASILALLEEIQSEGRTLILVTHDRNVAARANRVVAIADGRIAEEAATVEAV
jgi:putative ABC transport system ATP-binding protein